VKETNTRLNIRLAAKQRRNRIYGRWWFWFVVSVVVVVLALGAWVSVLALSAKAQLEAAIPIAATIKSQIVAGDSAGAALSVKTMAAHTQRARADAGAVVWRVAEVVPLVGPNLTAVRELATVVDDLLDDSVSPLVDVASTMRPEALRPVDGGIDLAPIVAARPALTRASAGFNEASNGVQNISTSVLVGPVATAVERLSALLSTYAPTLQSVSDLVSSLPGALGSDGPRNYLLVFQNNAEVMPRGGTIGNIALVHAENGHIQLSQQASPLDFPLLNSAVVPLADDALNVWPNGLGLNMQSLTMTPRFSVSFEIAREMWKQRFGTSIDGLIALDPIALSHILAVTGPVSLPDGSQLTGSNLVQGMLSDVYREYTDPLEADAYFQAISGATFGQIISGGADPLKLLNALVQSGEEKRLLIWTANSAEQKLIAKSPFYGEPPASNSTTDGFGVYFQDQTPSKMAFYLQQSVSVSQAQCSNKRVVRVTATLTNGLAADAVESIPYYVTGDGKATPKGSIRVGVASYAPAGYSLVRIVNDSDPAQNRSGTDGNFAVGVTRLTLGPGDSHTVTMDFATDDIATKKLVTDITPVVNPTSVGTVAADCSALG
jgi:hypothetical protein